jgi:hypothetical protein
MSKLMAAVWKQKLFFLMFFIISSLLLVLVGCGGNGGTSSNNANTTDNNSSSTTTLEWTWIGGSDMIGAAGVYGTQGTAAAGNVPGAREDSAAWVDANGNFWLFGGFGYDSASGTWGDLNDLWKYDPVANEWTWIGGSDTKNAPGVYGTQGTAAAGNIPGARENSAACVDANGNLWLFGGIGYSSTGQQLLNDLWEYDPVANEWTWVSGSDTYENSGVYGTQGTAAAGNIPGARELSSAWVDASGNFWLFGGEGYDSASANYLLNDLWEYDPEENQWTWMGGSDMVGADGVYGTQGTAAAGNVPGARGYSAACIDANGNFWLFGGDGFGSVGGEGDLNDLWVLNPLGGAADFGSGGGEGGGGF